MLLGAVVVWAFNFTSVKYGITHGFSPLTFAAPRFALAGLALAAFTLRQERTLRIARRDLGALAVAAVLGIALNQIFFVYALHLASAATIALLFGTGPVLVGVSGSFGGVLLGLATALTWAIYSVVAAPLMRRYSAYRLNASVSLLGSIILIAVAAPQLGSQSWSAIGPLAWIAFAYSLLAYVFGNIIWFVAIGRVGPTHAALFVNLEPFLGAIFAVLVLSEGVGILQLAGGLVIALAIFLSRGGRSQVPLAE
jgi:drug/metabolite transporter (DMT)-like permease